jgi:hypothetical protein
MIATEREKANLIALTHARTALRAATLHRSPSRRCYTPLGQRNNTPIAAVSHLSPRWPRAGPVAECAPRIHNQFYREMQAALTTFAQSKCFGTTANVGNFYTEAAAKSI